jgi:hypothetical protein
MKVFSLIFKVIKCVYFSSADPNLFGSRKRRKGKEAIAGEFKAMAGDTQAEIEALKTKDPFQSAAAKGAMARTARGAKEMQTRLFNVMGAGASPEALISAQGKTTEALGATAGQIATGAEAQKTAELAQLRGEKMGAMGTYAGIKKSAEEERGSGWTSLFEGISALGDLASGVGQAAGVFM